MQIQDILNERTSDKAGDFKKGDTVIIRSPIDAHNGEEGIIVAVEKQGMFSSVIGGDKIIFKVKVGGNVFAYGQNEITLT